MLTLHEAIGAASASCLEGFVAAAKRKLSELPDGQQGKKQRRLLNGTVRELERAVHAQKEASLGQHSHLVMRRRVLLSFCGRALSLHSWQVWSGAHAWCHYPQASEVLRSCPMLWHSCFGSWKARW